MWDFCPFELVFLKVGLGNGVSETRIKHLTILINILEEKYVKWVDGRLTDGVMHHPNPT